MSYKIFKALKKAGFKPKRVKSSKLPLQGEITREVCRRLELIGNSHEEAQKSNIRFKGSSYDSARSNNKPRKIFRNERYRKA